MSDYASQDDFDSLQENVNGLTDQVKTLSDSIGELKSTLTDMQAKFEKVTADLYDSPKFIRSDYQMDSGIATTCGILTNDTLLPCPTLPADVLLYSPNKG